MTWKIDKSRTTLQFSVKHMVIATVRGRFTEFDAELTFNPESLAMSGVDARIAARSVDTQDVTRDAYLRGDFLSPERFPFLTFKSTHVEARDKKVTVSGRFKIKDTERPLKLSGSFLGPYTVAGQRGMSFDLKGEFDREAFGLKFNQTVESVSVVVGKKVALQLRIDLLEEPEPAKEALP